MMLFRLTLPELRGLAHDGDAAIAAS